MKNVKKVILGAIPLAAMLLAGGSVQAVTIVLQVDLTDPYVLGQVVNGIQAGGQVARDVTMVNTLIPLAINTSQFVAPDDTYTRSGNAFSPLPAATDTGANFGTTPDGFSGFSGNSVLLTLTDTYRYLVAAYDGPNGGAVIYDIAGIASGTTLDLRRYAHPTVAGSPGTGPLVDGAGTNSFYQMTGFTFLNPGTTTVPDGGSTLALLGAALAGIGFLRRKIS